MGLYRKEEEGVVRVSTDELEGMFVRAIQGEINDRQTYLDLANRMESSFLRTKLRFLADEEEKHRVALEEMYEAYFPEKDLTLPEVELGPQSDEGLGDDVPIIQILETAMEYERSAQMNYLSLADQLSDNLETSVTLTYFAAMEASHLGLLKIEKEHLEKLKDAL